jgi:hypothetical protein
MTVRRFRRVAKLGRVAGRAVWPGITGLDVAGRGRLTVTVGSQLGSRLGYVSADSGPPRRWSSSAARVHAVMVGVLTPAEILIAARRLAGAGPT